MSINLEPVPMNPLQTLLYRLIKAALWGVVLWVVFVVVVVGYIVVAGSKLMSDNAKEERAYIQQQEQLRRR